MAWTQYDFGKATQALTPGAGPHAGMVDIFIAPALTLHTAAIGKIGLWQYLGVVKRGSPKNSFMSKLYDLMTGSPETIKKSYVIGVEGSYEFGIIEPTALAYAMSQAHGKMVGMQRTSSPVATTVSASPTPTNRTFTVASVTGIALYDELTVVTTAAPLGERVRVIGITGAALDVYPMLSSAPATGAAVKLIDGWEIALGTADVTPIALMGVSNDASTGRQIVTWIPQARSEGTDDDMADGQSEASIPFKFKALGMSSTDANGTAYNGPIVGKKFILNSAMALSYAAPAAS